MSLPILIINWSYWLVFANLQSSSVLTELKGVFLTAEVPRTNKQIIGNWLEFMLSHQKNAWISPSLYPLYWPPVDDTIPIGLDSDIWFHFGSNSGSHTNNSIIKPFISPIYLLWAKTNVENMQPMLLGFSFIASADCCFCQLKWSMTVYQLWIINVNSSATTIQIVFVG